MARKAYDEKLIENISRMDIDLECKNLTEEQRAIELKSPERRKKTIRNLTMLDLRDRLFVEYDGTRTIQECASEAKYLMDNVPEELIVNINEYLDGKALSDIKVHGVSVNDVYQMFVKHRPMHFIRILHCMAKWKSVNYFNDDFCWNYFALM